MLSSTVKSLQGKIITDVKEHYGLLNSLVSQAGWTHVDALAYNLSIHTSTFPCEKGVMSVPCLATALLGQCQIRAQYGDINKCRILLGRMPARPAICQTTYSKLHWRIHDGLHAKGWIFRRNKGSHIVSVLTTRNITASAWAEFSLILTGPEARHMASIFDNLWLEGQPLSKFTETSTQWAAEAKTFKLPGEQTDGQNTEEAENDSSSNSDSRGDASIGGESDRHRSTDGRATD